MQSSKHRGHVIEYNDRSWVYSDTGGLVSADPNRACGHCGKANTEEGHDGCLGILPGVMNACCGHGIAKDAYIQLLDKNVIHG